jgi:hypothetical protein
MVVPVDKAGIETFVVVSALAIGDGESCEYEPTSVMSELKK